MIHPFVEILRAVCRETLRAVYQLVPGWPITEQTVASWLLLHETEENDCFDDRSEEAYYERGTLGRATPLNCRQHRRGDISSLSDDLSTFFGTFRF